MERERSFRPEHVELILDLLFAVLLIGFVALVIFAMWVASEIWIEGTVRAIEPVIEEFTK